MLPYKGTLEAVLLVLLAVAVLSNLAALFLRVRGRNVPLLAVMIGAILLSIIAIVGFSYLRYLAVPPAPTSAPTATATPIPTFTPALTAAPTSEPTPTGEPTAAPTPTPVPTPTPTPDPYPFLSYGEPEKVETLDNDAGKWVYRSDILSVEVRREVYSIPDLLQEEVEGKVYSVNGGRDLGQPVTYFVAHVYTRDYDSFYPTFATNQKNGMDVCWPQEMALRYKSVLWFTGDNLIGERDAKGVLIRDGRVYSKNRYSNALAYYADTMTFKVIDRRALEAMDIWESGAQDVFSFPRGSDLIMNGQISSGAIKTTQRNPRCALGMVEPGHYVVIVADGRQPGYSIGFKLLELTKLMKQEGCVEAFNLDGGISTAIYFMGIKLNHHRDEAGTGGKVDYKQRRLPEGVAWGYSPLCGTLDGQPEG